jgi:hypothetical protein
MLVIGLFRFLRANCPQVLRRPFEPARALSETEAVHIKQALQWITWVEVSQCCQIAGVLAVRKPSEGSLPGSGSIAPV